MKEAVTRGEGRFIVALEVFQSWRELLSGLTVLLLCLGILGDAWLYSSGSPFDLVTLCVFVLLWKSYKRMLSVSGNEFRALSLFSLPWARVVIMKNLAVMALSILMFYSVSVVVLYFCPKTVSFSDTVHAVMFFLSVLFPMVSISNLRHLEGVERAGSVVWKDPEELVNLLAVLLLVGLPGKLLSGWEYGDDLMAVYVVVWIFIWRAGSVPKAARILDEKGWVE